MHNFPIFKAIKHIKMNRKDNQCEEAPNYDFADCLNNKIMFDVGCQPFWLHKSTINLNMCSNLSEYVNFISKYNKMTTLGPDIIKHRYKCLKPCSYMEYKVEKKDKKKF